MIKNVFNSFFYFLKIFCFQVVNFFILLNLLNSEIKRPLSDLFSMAAIGNSATKTHKCQTSRTLRQ